MASSSSNRDLSSRGNSLRTRTAGDETQSLPWPRLPGYDPQDDPWQPIVLALDGGGIRGLSSLYILRRLMMKIKFEEKKLRSQPNGQSGTSSHSAPGEHSEAETANNGRSEDDLDDGPLPKPCDYFDLIVGTSTGGLIAVMLGRLRVDIDTCIDEYKSLGTYIFGHWRWWRLTKYDHCRLETAIKDVLKRHCKEHGSANNCEGEDLLRQYDFSDREGIFKNRTCKVALVAVRESEQNKKGDTPYLFRSYDHVEPHPTSYNHFDEYELNPGRVQRDGTRIWEACRATSAAPLYFDKMTIVGVRYMDGGVDANNPAGYALYEALQMADRQGKLNAISLLVSVGTGQRAGQSRFRNLFALLQWMRKSITDSTRTHNQVSERMKATGTPYFRFDVEPMGNSDPGLSDMKLDENKKRKKKKEKAKKEKSQKKKEKVKKEKSEKVENQAADDPHAGTASQTANGTPANGAAQTDSTARSDSAAQSDSAAPSSTPAAENGAPQSSATGPAPPATPSSPDSEPPRKIRKGGYKPAKYEYKTYERIEETTNKYCDRGTTDHMTPNIDELLTNAARVLLYYRMRRETETPDEWREFTEHPYEAFQRRRREATASN